MSSPQASNLTPDRVPGSPELPKEFFKSPELRGFTPARVRIASLLAGLSAVPGAANDVIDLETALTKQQKLADKKVVISGSSQGIGFAVGFAMLEAGARVVFNSHEKSLSDEHLSDLRKAGYEENSHFFYYQSDMGEQAGAIDLVRQANELLGGLDCLVNNVGTYKPGHFLEIDAEELFRIQRINYYSHFWACQEFAKLVGQREWDASIISTSSINATQSEKEHVAYDSSKAGVSGLIRSLAIELQDQGIRCNTVSPGLIETFLTDYGLRSDEGVREKIKKQIPAGRIGIPIDVTAAYVYLASDDARYVNGEDIRIDGGVGAQQMT